MIPVNTLIKFESEGPLKAERILYCNDITNLLVTIDINSPNAMPIRRKLSSFKKMIRDNLVSIIKKDPYLANLDANNRPELHFKKRDEAWRIVRPLVTDKDGKPRIDIFFAKSRSKLIDQAVKENVGVGRATIYRYLRKYYQRGQVPNALFPDYFRSGAKGKERESNKKLGRPVSYNRAQGAPGISITEKIRGIFKKAIIKYYKKPMRITRLFQIILEESFGDGFEVKGNSFVPKLLTPEKRPTFTQFNHYFRKFWDKDLTENLKRYYGAREYEQKYSAIEGTSTEMASGPGYLFQLDSTIVDIYLVSKLDRSKIIGRPTLYVVIDVFSKLIAGFSLTLEPPSWTAASYCFLNMLEDKVKFCEKYGIAINEEEWPNHFAPVEIIADRGESISKNSDVLINRLKIDVSNTPPYYPTWKPIVEQEFNLINVEVIDDQPAYVDKNKNRGDHDYRLDATYTLEELTRIFIHLFLYHNNNHTISFDGMEQRLITDKVEPYPANAWDWGINNLSGGLRTISLDLARTYLLPSDKGSVTEYGIKYKGRIYDSKYATNNGWLTKARTEGRWKIDIQYTPHDVNNIYFIAEKGEYEVCELSERSKRFRGTNIFEIMDWEQDQKAITPDRQHNDRQAKAELNAHINSIKKPAQAAAKEAKSGLSKSSLTKNIGKNRANEKELEREKNKKPETNKEKNISENEGYIPLHKPAEFINKMEKEYQNEQYKTQKKDNSKKRNSKQKQGKGSKGTRNKKHR